jgi:hypothetical protein
MTSNFFRRLWPAGSKNTLSEVSKKEQELSALELFKKSTRTAKPLKKPRKHEEYDLQCTCVEWFDKEFPELVPLFFHIPNEGARTPKQGYQLKLMGKRAGVWDSFLSVPKQMPDNDWYHGAYYEFKPSEKRKLSHNQKLFGAAAFNNRYALEVIISKEQFIEHVTWYLALPKP